MMLTSPMRTTPSFRQPDQTTARQDVTLRSTVLAASTVDSTPPEQTLRTIEGGPMFEITSLEVEDMDITTPE